MVFLWFRLGAPRFADNDAAQVLGQSFGIPVPFVLTLFIGMWLAGATTVAYGKAGMDKDRL
jgi:cytosine/uracil/thiamine/allantoin permease